MEAMSCQYVRATLSVGSSEFDLWTRRTVAVSAHLGLFEGEGHM